MPTRRVRLDRTVASQIYFDPLKVVEIAKKDPASFDTVPVAGKCEDGMLVWVMGIIGSQQLSSGGTDMSMYELRVSPSQASRWSPPRSES